MDLHRQTLKLSYNPLNLFLRREKRHGLRIGYMEAALEGFYLNCIETGIHSNQLNTLLSGQYHCTGLDSIKKLLQSLLNEGDRRTYQLIVPYLLSTNSLQELEKVLNERFIGMDNLIRQGKNLYKFVKYTEYRKEPVIWINDLERGIIGWDMGQLVCLARTAQGCGYITKKEAWEYIEQAGALCAKTLHSQEEIDKSFLIGRAMKSGKLDEWDQALFHYSLIRKYGI